MKILIEDVTDRQAQGLVQFLNQKELGDCGLNVRKVAIVRSTRWVTTQGSASGFHVDELMVVKDIAFDLEPFDDNAIRILTSAFSGSGLTFSVPQMPGFRWTIA